MHVLTSAITTLLYADYLSQQSQLIRAINREDFEDAARLKVAIAAAATNDTVGRVMSYLNVGAMIYCYFKE